MFVCLSLSEPTQYAGDGEPNIGEKKGFAGKNDCRELNNNSAINLLIAVIIIRMTTVVMIMY